ncbi:Uncharacterised protein [Vibrio cholerae]|nr:Uncharacterised protein [Vibrio cholerae]
MQNGVTVEEGSTTRVLTRDTDALTVIKQCGIRKRFSHTPIQHLLARDHRETILIDFFYTAMQHMAFRILANTTTKILQSLHRIFAIPRDMPVVT